MTPFRFTVIHAITTSMSKFTLNQLVFESGDKDAPAVVSPALGNSVLSRAQLKQISLEAADSIRAHRSRDALGIQGQDVVAMSLPNGLPFLLAFLGVTARGAVAAPLNPGYTVPEFEVCVISRDWRCASRSRL